MSLVILPGSYDPMTMGHFRLLCRALEQFDEAVVAVMVNPAKQTLLDMETRVELARLTVRDLPNVQVVSDTGMLVDLYDRLGADAVCKGWRNETDYAYESEMAEWNRAHNPHFRTVLLHADGEHASLSSTEVRRLLLNKEIPQGLVHPNAMPLLLKAVGLTQPSNN